MERAQGRYQKAKKAARPYQKSSMVMQKFPWSNPLKGGNEKVAMAEVSVKGFGLFVGFKFKL